MTTRTNYRYFAPIDPTAEKACRLNAEMSSRRTESPEDFFAGAEDQVVLPNGYELHFPEPDADKRIDAFIAAEQECCPFFAFETWQEAGKHVIRILRLDDDAETPEKLPPAAAQTDRWRTGFKPGDGDQG